MWKYIIAVVLAVGFISPAFAGLPILPQEPCQPCLCADGLPNPVLEQNITIPRPEGCVETVCRNTDAVCLCGWQVNRPHPMGTHTEIVECIRTDDGIQADCEDGYGVVIPQTRCRRFCDCADNGFPPIPPIICQVDRDCPPTYHCIEPPGICEPDVF